MTKTLVIVAVIVAVGVGVAWFVGRAPAPVAEPTPEPYQRTGRRRRGAPSLGDVGGVLSRIAGTAASLASGGGGSKVAATLGS